MFPIAPKKFETTSEPIREHDPKKIETWQGIVSKMQRIQTSAQLQLCLTIKREITALGTSDKTTPILNALNALAAKTEAVTAEKLFREYCTQSALEKIGELKQEFPHLNVDCRLEGYEKTALEVAVQNLDAPLVSRLLQCGAHPRYVNFYQMPIQREKALNQKNTFTTIIQMLLDANREIESKPLKQRKIYPCAYCQEKTLQKVRKCSRCLSAAYCNTDCQTAHWKEHKLACPALRNDKIHQTIQMPPGPKKERLLKKLQLSETERNSVFSPT